MPNRRRPIILDPKHWKSYPWKSSTKDVWNTISIEPVFFLFALCQGFYIVISKKLYLDKVCMVNLNYTREICDDLVQYESEQIEVQKYVSSLQAYNSMIQTVPSVFWALLLGPWSDKNGRKTLIICSTFGYVFNNAVFMLNTYYFYELPAEYLLFECLQDCTGGYVCFYLACYSYIADVSEPEKRTKRLAYLDGLWPLGFYIGNASSGIIKVRLGYMYNFSLGMLCAVAAMAYTYVFVPDSRPIRDARLAKGQRSRQIEMMTLNDAEKRIEHCQEELNSSKAVDGVVHHPKAGKINDGDAQTKKETNVIKELFNPENFKEAWRALIKKRDGHKKMFIILLIVAFELEMFLSHGRWSGLFLFFRKQLKWSTIQYTTFTTTLGFIGLFGQYIAVPILSGWLRLHDSTISLIDAVTSFANCFILAFCVNWWMPYVGAGIALLDNTSTTLFRSLITKCVDPDEVGKIFSIVGAFQAFLPFASSPLFGFLYRATVSTFPAAFLFLVAALKLVEGVVVFIVFITFKKDEKKFRQIAMDEKEQEKSELPPLLGTKEVKESVELEKED